MNFYFLGHTGQGVATTARLAARTALATGMKVQLNLPKPSMHNDKREAYLRLAKPKEEITEKGPISNPDFTIVFDISMIKQNLKDLKEHSTLIVKSQERFSNPILKKNKIRVLSVDATGIALKLTAKPFPAAPMIGALSKAFPRLSLKAIKSAIEAEFYDHVAENQTAAEEGYKTAR